nr:50S ribosomal protein L7/L12 [uncultured Capnocytophaga sp.]
MTPADIEQIKTLVHEGNKLAAVKLLMDTAHIGLKDAKDIIDDFFLGKETDINERVKRVSYSDTAERFTAEADPNGENPHFFYHKGSIKEEVTPGHPMWERIKTVFAPIEGLPADIARMRENYAKAIEEMEAKAGYTAKKGAQTTYRKGQASDKRETLFIKKSPLDFLKWYFYLFIAAAIVYILYLVTNDQ